MYKVMIVEDEPPLARDLKYEIERASSVFQVTATAINGFDALRVMEQELPDAIFTDIRMPVMDGLQFIQAVRARALAIPVVILSGYRDFEYAQTAVKYQAFHYLLKPISPSGLQEVLENLQARLDESEEAKRREAMLLALQGDPYEQDGLRPWAGGIEMAGEPEGAGKRKAAGKHQGAGVREEAGKHEGAGLREVAGKREAGDQHELAGHALPVLTDERLSSLRAFIQMQQKSLFKAEWTSLLGSLRSSALPDSDLTALLKRLIYAIGNGQWRTDLGDGDIQAAVDKAIDGAASSQAAGDALWAWLERAWFADHSSRSTPEGVVSKLDDYLKANCHQSFDPRSLAADVGLTPPYLSKLFKLYKGMPLIEYLAYLKVEKAKELMRAEPELLAREIGEMLGFADPFYFSRLFKKVEGCSPSDYRKQLVERDRS